MNLMCRVPILPVALAILASLILSSRATLPVDWTDAVAWYDSLGFPDTKELPYVRVATGQSKWRKLGAQPEENRYVEGFVVQEDPSAFTVFICSVSYFDDWTELSEPYPALTTVRFVPKTSGPAYQRVGYEVLDFKAVAADVLERVRAQATTPRDGLQWGRRVSHRVRIFAFARACLQRADLLETGSTLMNLAANIPDEQTGEVDPRKFTSTLQQKLGDAVLTRAEAQFADSAMSWKELLKAYEQFEFRYPANQELAYAKEAAQLLRSAIAEDASHHPKPLEQMTPAEEVAEHIYQLRNMGRCQWVMNGHYPVYARSQAGGTDFTPVHRLVDLGYEAVPQLIAALDDRRFTRCMFDFHNTSAAPKVMRVGDVAERILRAHVRSELLSPENG